MLLTAVATAFVRGFTWPFPARSAWKFVELFRTFPRSPARSSLFGLLLTFNIYHKFFVLFCLFYLKPNFLKLCIFNYFSLIFALFAQQNPHNFFLSIFSKHHFFIFPSSFKRNKLIAVQGFVPKSANNILA